MILENKSKHHSNFQRYPLKQKENAFLNLKYYSFKHFTSIIIYVWKNYWFMLNTVWYTVNNVTTHPSSESIKLLQPKHLVCQGTSRSQMPSDLVHFTIYIFMHLYMFEKMYNLKTSSDHACPRFQNPGPGLTHW